MFATKEYEGRVVLPSKGRWSKMHTWEKAEICHYSVVYSAEWAKAIAIKYLSGYIDTDGNRTVSIASDIESIFSLLNEKKTDVLILDIPARNYVNLLCHIRRRYPAMPIIITQSRIFFSDRVVGSWFGNIWLREYDSLMAGYPDSLASDCVAEPQFASVDCTAACLKRCSGNRNDIKLLNDVEQWLRERLTERVRSLNGVRVVTEWLSRGVSPREAGVRLQRSTKLVYHYRSKVIQALNITGHPGDFIPSLSLEEGPTPRINPDICLMQSSNSDKPF